MAYIVNKTNNDIIATVADGSIDTTSTSLTLIGKGFNNYGEIVAENFVHLLEHFASTTAPAAALRGQLWFDNTSNSIKMNISNNPSSPQWVESGKAIISGTQPFIGTFTAGSFWYEPTTAVLHIANSLSTFISLKTIKVGILPAVTSAEPGDIFFDINNNELRVLNPNSKETGTVAWDIIGIKVSATAPTTLTTGDLWYDDVNKQVNVYTDTLASNTLIVGPLFPISSNSKIAEANTNINPMMGFTVGNDPIAILSSTTTANPGGSFTSLGAINRGLTVDNSINISTVAGQVSWTTGSGTPEGNVVAGIGSMYTDINGGAGTTLYIKESGANSTGWVAK